MRASEAVLSLCGRNCIGECHSRCSHGDVTAFATKTMHMAVQAHFMSGKENEAMEGRKAG